MISVNYYIADGTTAPLLWPAVVRVTSNGDVTISEEAVNSEEAELAGVDISEYFTTYKAYVSAYLDSLTSYSDETSLDQMDSHRNIESAVKYFNFFMAPKWHAEMQNLV